MFPTQRPPDISRFDPVFEQFRGSFAIFHQHVRVQQPWAVLGSKFVVDEVVKIGQSHETNLQDTCH
ncbi:hypothetical protein HMPREF2708_03580 [Corynebacterium sp. HMSC073H12]|nr:hypothetical protein HMPREF2708_03580 [Corynebacterium sp. HMSC073H12]